MDSVQPCGDTTRARGRPEGQGVGQSGGEGLYCWARDCNVQGGKAVQVNNKHMTHLSVLYRRQEPNKKFYENLCYILFFIVHFSRKKIGSIFKTFSIIPIFARCVYAQVLNYAVNKIENWYVEVVYYYLTLQIADIIYKNLKY